MINSPQLCRINSNLKWRDCDYTAEWVGWEATTNLLQAHSLETFTFFKALTTISDLSSDICSVIIYLRSPYDLNEGLLRVWECVWDGLNSRTYYLSFFSCFTFKFIFCIESYLSYAYNINYCFIWFFFDYHAFETLRRNKQIKHPYKYRCLYTVCWWSICYRMVINRSRMRIMLKGWIWLPNVLWMKTQQLQFNCIWRSKDVFFLFGDQFRLRTELLHTNGAPCQIPTGLDILRKFV